MLQNVVSINASGHKYGLVYPGVGWVVWRSKEFLPESMVFHTSEPRSLPTDCKDSLCSSCMCLWVARQ